jgi:hypothetical protein
MFAGTEHAHDGGALGDRLHELSPLLQLITPLARGKKLKTPADLRQGQTLT